MIGGGSVTPGRIITCHADDSWVQFTASGQNKVYDFTTFEDYEEGDTWDTFDYLRVSFAHHTTPYPSVARHYSIKNDFAATADAVRIELHYSGQDAITVTRLSDTTMRATLSKLAGSNAIIGFVELMKSPS